MILKQDMGMGAIGTGIGAVLAFVAFRGLRSVLYGVNSTDLLRMSSVSLLLLAVAFPASYIPAMRATRIDPVVALRDEYRRKRTDSRTRGALGAIPDGADGL